MRICINTIDEKKNKENDTAITGLAFLGRGNDRGQTMSHQIEEISSEKDDEDERDIIEFKLTKSELTKKIESIKWKYVAGFFVFFECSSLFTGHVFVFGVNHAGCSKRGCK